MWGWVGWFFTLGRTWPRFELLSLQDSRKEVLGVLHLLKSKVHIGSPHTYIQIRPVLVGFPQEQTSRQGFGWRCFIWEVIPGRDRESGVSQEVCIRMSGIPLWATEVQTLWGPLRDYGTVPWGVWCYDLNLPTPILTRPGCVGKHIPLVAMEHPGGIP